MKPLNELNQQKILEQDVIEINNAIKKMINIAELVKQEALKIKTNEDNRSHG